MRFRFVFLYLWVVDRFCWLNGMKSLDINLLWILMLVFVIENVSFFFCFFDCFICIEMLFWCVNLRVFEMRLLRICMMWDGLFKYWVLIFGLILIVKFNFCWVVIGVKSFCVLDIRFLIGKLVILIFNCDVLIFEKFRRLFRVVESVLLFWCIMLIILFCEVFRFFCLSVKIIFFMLFRGVWILWFIMVKKLDFVLLVFFVLCFVCLSFVSVWCNLNLLIMMVVKFLSCFKLFLLIGVIWL